MSETTAVPFTVLRSHSSVGRSSIDVVCPFCATTVRLFLWSLAGSGKRCTCGALHTNTGTYKRADDG